MTAFMETELGMFRKFFHFNFVSTIYCIHVSFKKIFMCAITMRVIYYLL